MVLKRLNCHPATLHYRETRGQLVGIKIAGKKYYHAAEVEQLRKYNPVHKKPHYSKRKPACGGGPGSGEILINNQPAVIVRAQSEQPKQSLWSKIKSLFSASAAK